MKMMTREDREDVKQMIGVAVDELKKMIQKGDRDMEIYEKVISSYEKANGVFEKYNKDIEDLKSRISMLEEAVKPMVDSEESGVEKQQPPKSKTK